MRRIIVKKALILFTFFSVVGMVVFGLHNFYSQGGGIIPEEISQKSSISIERFRTLSHEMQIRALDDMSNIQNFDTVWSFLKSAYPDEPPSKHDLSHKLGEIAIKELGLDGFGRCDTFLNFGCFHGAALAAIRFHGEQPLLGEGLWEACRRSSPFPGNCLHGLGHAIMVIKQYNLLKAYEECERFLNSDESFWCQDGVTMENITRSMIDSESEPYGSDEDPYYPCNSIPQKYEAVCVRNHIGFLQRNFGFNLEEMVAFCLSFKEEQTRQECISMIGSQDAEVLYDDPEAVIEHCRKSGAYFRFCIFGAVTNFSMTKRFAYAEQLCATFLNIEDQSACLNRIQSFRSQQNF